jgi:peroxiredoxin (alkyl hydroperoxide reductase subunit C)
MSRAVAGAAEPLDNQNPKEGIRMSDTPMGLKLGQTVPDFELTTFDPTKGDFGKFSLKEQIARKRWSIFFYPADFTFV